MKSTTSKDGTRIAYHSEGSGTPLILIDGALCSTDMGPMSKLMLLMADHFKVFIYDRRGRHNSGDTKPYDMAREIEDLQALINEAGGHAFVFGISSGASLALAAAESGLSIAKIAVYEPPPDNRQISSAASRLNLLLDADRRSGAVKYFLKDLVGLPAIITFIMQILPVWSKLKKVAHTLPYDILIMSETPGIIQKASDIKIPAWVAAGEKSPRLFHEVTKKLSDSLPNDEYKIIPGQDHNVSTKVLAPLLIEFFKKPSYDSD